MLLSCVYYEYHERNDGRPPSHDEYRATTRMAAACGKMTLKRARPFFADVQGSHSTDVLPYSLGDVNGDGKVDALDVRDLATWNNERIRNMATRNYDERIADLQKRQEQLKAQEKALKKRQSEEERKKRTRRLIELGATVESVLERPTTDEDKIRLLNFLKKQESNGKYFTKAMNADAARPEENVE